LPLMFDRTVISEEIFYLLTVCLLEVPSNFSRKISQRDLILKSESEDPLNSFTFFWVFIKVAHCGLYQLRSRLELVDIVVLANLDIDLGRLLRMGHFDKCDDNFE
jgi:hypothetical protein